MPRVVLTGVGGFIGHHCLEYFLEHTDWHIVGIDSFRHKGTVSRLDAVPNYDPQRVTILRHDLAVPIDRALENQILGRTFGCDGDCIDIIINMASDSAVERSVTDPVPCLRNNYDLAINMLEFARQVRPRIFYQISTDEVYGEAGEDAHVEWDVIMPSNPYSASKAAQEAVAISYWRTYGVPVVITNTMNCHDIKTKALTPTGPKLAKELKQGDEVFVLDSSGTVRVEPINGIVIRQHNGEMVRVRHKKSSQLVTPDHRMLIQRPVGKSRRYGSYEYVPANYLSEINRARIPVAGKWHGHAVLGEVVPTSKFVEQEEPHPDAKRLPPSLRWDWLAEIAGWYVSEGCLAPGFISFGQKKEANRERISMLLRDVGLRATPAERAITTSSQALSLILREFGTLAPNKLPRWLKDLPSELLGVFFHAAVAGDGTSYSNKNGSMRYVYYTTSRQLATDMAEVGIKIGLSARISDRKTWSPNKTKKSRSYVVGFRHNVCDVESRNITHEYYEGLVWCLTVPSGNFAIMRDGIVSFSGNCIGEGQDKEKFLPKLIWKVATGQEMEIYGEPGAIGSRFYLHAKNMADALVFLASRCPAKYLSSPRPDRYNVVGDVELDNLEVAQMIAEIMGLSLKYRLVPSESARPGYDRRYALNGKKMEAMGWRAPLPTTVAFQKIVQWTLANPQWVL